MAPPQPDDSDAEDDDYVYQAPSDDEGDVAVTLEQDTVALTGIKEENRSVIDDMFAEMNGSGKGVTASAAKGDKKSKKVAKKEKRTKSVLADIFGSSSVAKKLIKNRPLDLTSGVAKRPLVALEKKVVKEVKRFAGKEIVVEKTVIVDRNVRPVEVVASAKGAKKGAARDGLDSVLDDLKGPEKISTIAKTSTDWDGFKEKTGMSEEMEKATANGYLVKKDFLNRCDTRQFENEKEGREKDRLKK